MDCKNCAYCWADLDEEGRPISLEYCHYDGLEGWAPCEYEEPYEEYPEEDHSAEIEEYEQWLYDQAQRELDEEYHEEYEAPYDYQEF